MTGGAGFIGAALVGRLLGEGVEVTVVDDGSAAGWSRLEPLGGRLALHRLDVRDPGLPAVVDGAAPHVLFHLAAQVDVGRSVADPLQDASVNVLGTHAVLEAARHLTRPARVVLAASGGSWHGPEAALVRPTPETGARGPVSPYGLSKAAGVDYLDLYRHLHGLEGCALALANVYGPGQDGGGEAAVVRAFVEAVATGCDLLVHGDGEQTRDLVYVDDVVDAFWRAATAPAVAGGPARYNIGTGHETTVNELARLLLHRSGRHLGVRHGPARPGEVRHSSLDPTLAADRLGWRPVTTLDDGLAATLAWRLGGAGPAEADRAGRA